LEEGMMKRQLSIVALALVAALLALTGGASAAQPGQAISFSMGHTPFFGSFCTTGGCIWDVTADFDGRISASDELSVLAGTLQIGTSPFGNTSRHLMVTANDPATETPFEFGAFEACTLGLTPSFLFSTRGTQASVIVSLGAGNLRGTGNLTWGTQETCRVDEFGDPVVTPPTGFASLDAELVGPGTSGRLLANGPGPVIGP
jgi:hypothetical protein